MAISRRLSAGLCTRIERHVTAVGGRNADGEADHASHAHVSIRVGHGVGGLRGLFPAASSPLSGTGAYADRHLEGAALTAAVHLLAVSCLAASGYRAATVGSAAAHARARVGG